ncbi:MAG: ABC transporter ATP-binding protein [Thermoleophilia bacterium]
MAEDPRPAPSLGADGIHLALGGVPVLAGIDLRVEPGEMVALVGPSGCGKSTLLHVLAGLRDADSGEVLVDDRPPAGLPGAVTLMPQHDALLPWRTVVENVALARTLAGDPAGEARRRARHTLARFGLAGFEEHYPHALSGGMRQRVALARTLLAGSRAWLLDEPFGALDALTRADLQGVLAAAWGQDRPTALLVTHDLDEALLLADRVLVCGPRPARIVAEVDVDLPRPRSAEDRARPEVAALRARLLDALRAAGAVA